METNELVRRLALGAGPVKPLDPPWIRTVRWFAIGLPWVAVVIVVMSPRADLAIKLGEVRFLLEQAAALATAITAALAAFCFGIPGYSRKLVLLPVLSLAIWLGSLGQGCLDNWMRYGDEAWQLMPDWVCFPAILFVGTVPALAIVSMLRKGAPISPTVTLALAGLAAAAMGNFGLRFFHAQDASLMVLVWQFGSVMLLSILAAFCGRHILRWPG